jgi:hypothetical protein
MGNIYSSSHQEWDFTSVPWTPGEDFTAPTCAACHMSLLVDVEDDVVVRRTHRVSDRLHARLFGLPYAHPHPRDPNTSLIINKAGLQLPTELNGQPVSQALINEEQQAKRMETMKAVCLQCHSRQWADAHFAGLEHVNETTNQMTLTATRLLQQAWREGLAVGLEQDGSIFDEAIERMWVEQWLFYANSTRLSAAMAGADYGVFANGRWYMSKNLQQMLDWLEFSRAAQK